MSESDSFIQEVSDEVRRDNLYRMMRKYGWIAILAVILLVGAAAWTEYTKAQARAQAEARGDAMLAALSENDLAARAEAFDALDTSGESAAVTALMAAAAQQDAGETATAIATLDALATNGAVPQVYRDLAAFKSALLDAGTDPATRRQKLETLAAPGQPFALLAQEQLALADLAQGDRDAAVTRLTAILEDAGVTQGLRDRAQTLMVSLGAPLPETVTTTNP